jgi:hypothetical protein
MVTLAAAGYEVWLPSRFRRIPAPDGAWLIDSADLTEVNPERSKRIAEGNFGDSYGARVSPGWILMARSGQTYGIIGSLVLAGKDFEGDIISDHVMRLKPPVNSELRPGYVVAVLSHPVLGRPVVKSLAYGSSIPEIDVADVLDLSIPRIDIEEEAAIADLAEESAECRAKADMIEREMSGIASAILDGFVRKVRTKQADS